MFAGSFSSLSPAFVSLLVLTVAATRHFSAAGRVWPNETSTDRDTDTVQAQDAAKLRAKKETKRTTSVIFTAKAFVTHGNLSAAAVVPPPSTMVAAENDLFAQVVRSAPDATFAADPADERSATAPQECDCSAPLPEAVRELNANLTDLDDVLLWAHKHCPEGKLVQVTSFGPSGMVILHQMRELGILSSIPTVSFDTLHLFPETYDFVDRVQAAYSDMSLRKFRPIGYDSREAFVEDHGPDLWRTRPDDYDHLVKVEPMMRAMDELRPRAWITGRRSSQGAERSDLPIFEIDHDDPGRIKINPLARWTYEQVWDYIRRHNVPYNPLHDRGYKSIGDVQTTKPVARDADERSGRFLGLGGKTECGLHSKNRPNKFRAKKNFAVEATA